MIIPLALTGPRIFVAGLALSMALFSTSVAAHWQQGAATVWQAVLAAQMEAMGKAKLDRPKESAPVVVLIIDDIGHDRAAGKAVLALPGKLTVAILPYTPFARSLAEQAFAAGKEVMLHAPMANVRDFPLGRGGLTPDMEEQTLRTTLAGAIAQIPHVKGVNNHMGSMLTTLPQPMEWVMQELKSRDLFFVDSRTNHLTVAAKMAQQYGVPQLSRDVFLDNERNAEHIDRAFQRLLDKARRKGMAIGIGHPYPETTAYLRQALPKLMSEGFVLLTVSEALEQARKNRQ